MRTRVKICGIGSAADLHQAAQAGVDALGFVFYPPSPRFISLAKAIDLVPQVPSFIARVGLFVNASQGEIEQVLKQVPLTLLQFHGDEAADFCQQFGLPWLKAVRMRPDVNLHALRETYQQAAGLLVDNYTQGVPGGTGQVFDWQLIPKDLRQNIILAGGLEVGNVAKAITQIRPYGVDVSGGVEINKGVKDPVRIRAFMHQVSEANHTLLGLDSQ